MKKLFAVMVVTLTSAMVFGEGVAEPGHPAHARTDATPVVSVIALSPEQAQELAKVRGEYSTRKAQLEAEHAAQLEAILAKPTSSNI